MSDFQELRQPSSEPTSAEAPGAKEPLDRFDPANFRVDPQTALVDVERVTMAIPVGKPGRQEFFRVHSEPLTDCYLVKDEREGDLYIVPSNCLGLVEGEAKFYRLYLTVDRHGVRRVWPVRVAMPDERNNSYWVTAHEIAELAQNAWVRLENAGGHYNAVRAKSVDIEPQFGSMSPGEVLKLAFKDRIIEDIDHPLLRALRGEL